jgi:hypothetical protein
MSNVEVAAGLPSPLRFDIPNAGRRGSCSECPYLTVITGNKMTQFKIVDSFVIQNIGFVFKGVILSGKACPGMTFKVPEAGHQLNMVVKSVEIMGMMSGKTKVNIIVENPSPGYLPGLGVGWTATLVEQLK